jgi:exodeoxyribonuclease X
VEFIMIAAFIDTEGTGLLEPEPVEVALYIVPDGPRHWPVDRNMLVTRRYEPSKPIELGAMATHHIIPCDVRGCPPSSSFVLTPAVKYIVAHNADYDWGVIGKPEVKRICTLALAKRLWPELESHKLAALMYARFGATPEIRDRVKQAHGAEADVLMLFDVWCELLDEATRRELLWPNTTWEEVWQLSEKARVPLRMEFGKYGPNTPEGGTQGMLIEFLRLHDRGYVGWLLSGKCDQVNDNPYLRKALTQ